MFDTRRVGTGRSDTCLNALARGSLLPATMDSDLEDFFREQEERFRITSEDEKEFEAYTAHVAAR